MSELTSDHPVETFVAAMIENVQIVKLLIEDGHNMDREERDILILRAIELDAIPFNYEIFCSMTDIHKELVMEAMTRANHLYKHAYKQNQKPWPTFIKRHNPGMGRRPFYSESNEAAREDLLCE